MKLPKCDLLGIGLSVYDQNLFVGEHPGPDDKITASSSSVSLGGPACIGTLCANRLGLKTALLSCVGDDPQGTYIRKTQQSFKSHSLLEVPSKISAHGTIIIKSNGERSVIAVPPKDIRYPAITLEKAPKYILCDGRLGCEYYELIEKLISQGSQLILDAGSLNAGIKKLLKICSTLICSKKFALSYSNQKESSKAFAFLAKEFAKVAITQGSDPILYNNDGELGQINPLKIKLKNSNGAGDIFHGSFIAALDHGFNYVESLSKANEIAAWHCTQKNTKDSLNNLGSQKFF